MDKVIADKTRQDNCSCYSSYVNKFIGVKIIGELDLIYEHARRVYDPDFCSCAVTVDGANDIKILEKN